MGVAYDCCRRHALDFRAVLGRAAKEEGVRMYDIQQAVDHRRAGRLPARLRRTFFRCVLDGLIQNNKGGSKGETE